MSLEEDGRKQLAAIDAAVEEAKRSAQQFFKKAQTVSQEYKEMEEAGIQKWALALAGSAHKLPQIVDRALQRLGRFEGMMNLPQLLAAGRGAGGNEVLGRETEEWRALTARLQQPDVVVDAAQARLVLAENFSQTNWGAYAAEHCTASLEAVRKDAKRLADAQKEQIDAWTSSISFFVQELLRVIPVRQAMETVRADFVESKLQSLVHKAEEEVSFLYDGQNRLDVLDATIEQCRAVVEGMPRKIHTILAEYNALQDGKVSSAVQSWVGLGLVEVDSAKTMPTFVSQALERLGAAEKINGANLDETLKALRRDGGGERVKRETNEWTVLTRRLSELQAATPRLDPAVAEGPRPTLETRLFENPEKLPVWQQYAAGLCGKTLETVKEEAEALVAQQKPRREEYFRLQTLFQGVGVHRSRRLGTNAGTDLISAPKVNHFLLTGGRAGATSTSTPKHSFFWPELIAVGLKQELEDGPVKRARTEYDDAAEQFRSASEPTWGNSMSACVRRRLGLAVADPTAVFVNECEEIKKRFESGVGADNFFPAKFNCLSVKDREVAMERLLLTKEQRSARGGVVATTPGASSFWQAAPFRELLGSDGALPDRKPAAELFSSMEEADWQRWKVAEHQQFLAQLAEDLGVAEDSAPLLEILGVSFEQEALTAVEEQSFEQALTAVGTRWHNASQQCAAMAQRCVEELCGDCRQEMREEIGKKRGDLLKQKDDAEKERERARWCRSCRHRAGAPQAAAVIRESNKPHED